MAIELDTKRGVVNSYGVRTTKPRYGGDVPDDLVQIASWTWSFDDLPVWSASKLEHNLPAFAKILSANLEVLTPWVGGTSLAVGTVNASDGTGGTAGGFVTAVQAATANINARGQFITGTGALVGASVGSVPQELNVVAVGTYTAGKARLVVRYIIEGV